MHQGVWQKPGGALAVALKMVKPGSSEQERVKFLQEAAIIGQFHHKNILTLHGVVTIGEPVSPFLQLLLFHSVETLSGVDGPGVDE